MSGAIINIPTGLSLEAVSDGFLAAVPDGLIYLNYFGADRLDRDLAEVQDPTILGNPVVDGRWMEGFGNSRGVTPGFSQQADFTYMAVFRQTAAANAMIFGNFNGTGDGGAWLYVDNATGVIQLGAIIGGALVNLGNSSFIRAADSTPYLVTGQFNSGTGQRLLECPTLSALTSATGSAPDATSNKPRVGAAVASYTQTTQIAFAAAWNRALSAAERALAYAQIRAFMSANGITV